MTSPSGPPPSSVAGAAPERAALSRELSEFLLDFSIALHKHAMYPEGHPSLKPAADRVVRRGATLLQDRSTLALGVARDQLIIEGVATDPKHPVLAELAGRLHRHHLGGITFSRGFDGAEVEDVLRTIAREADRTGQPLGLGDRDLLSAWPHIRLYPMTYEKLELIDPDTNEPMQGGLGRPDEHELRDARVRGAQMWIGLARAALVGQIGEEEEPSTKPSVIAKAIDDHQTTEGAEAYDQVIVGYMMQIAEELKSAGSMEGVELRRRTSRLVKAMQPETLRRLVEMGGDGAQRRKFVLDATHGMAVDAVLEVVKAAADASKQSVSQPLLRLLSKLAAHAEHGAPATRTAADTAIRDQVLGLLSGWELSGPNPETYDHVLEKLSQESPDTAMDEEPRSVAEPERIVRMSLEVDAVGPNVFRACAALVDQGRLGELVGLLEETSENSQALRELWERAASRETLSWLLTTEPVDFALVDRLMPRLGERAADPLLDALADSESRATRRALLDRLVRLAPVLGPCITARLNDERWYVKRNLLTLLDELPELPVGFSALQWMRHDDPRVRLEACKLGLKDRAERDKVIVEALGDADGRLVRLALIAALRGVPIGAVPRLITLVKNASVSRDVRLQAIRLLGQTSSVTALDVLLSLTVGRRAFFRLGRLPAKSPELVAALSALATGWSQEPRATAVLARAALSSDPEILAATDPREHATRGRDGNA